MQLEGGGYNLGKMSEILNGSEFLVLCVLTHLKANMLMWHTAVSKAQTA